MIEHFQLQSLIQRITHAKDGNSFKGSIIHPQRDWALGVGVSFILLLGVGVISWQFYMAATNIPELTAEEVGTVVSYRESLIERALDEYQDLATKYQTNLVATSNSVPIAVETDSSAAATSTDAVATTSLPVATSTQPATDTAISAPSDDTSNEPNAASAEAPVLAN